MYDNNSSKYNYHSHTYRCGHASFLPDSTYLTVAQNNGYTKYGISDHVPVYPIFFWDNKVRMHNSEVDEYLNSIADLKEIFKNELEVFSGFEAEYDEIVEEHLCSLKEKCDYMMLGQHYILNKNMYNDSSYPLEYAKKVCSGIESGIFDIVAHPDVFMKFLPTNNTKRKEFLKNALIAANMICDKAKEYNIPIELNLGCNFGSKKDKNASDNFLIYPSKIFWDVAIAKGNITVIGIDAHNPMEIINSEQKLLLIGKYIDLSKINFLPNDYDPVKARKNNIKLQEAYQKTKNNLSSVEKRLISSLLDQYFNNYKIIKRSYGAITYIEDYLKNINIITYKSKRKVDLEDNQLTIEYRNELIDTIYNIYDKMSLKTKLNLKEFRDNLLLGIDEYYQKKMDNDDNKKKSLK